MATQKGLLQLSGSLGELIFYQVKHQNRVRRKGKGNTHQLSEGSKKSSRDFGYASHLSARIRNFCFPTLKIFADDTVINRLNSTMVKVLRTSNAAVGERKLAGTQLSLLNHFQFNARTSFLSLLPHSPSFSINNESLTVGLYAFNQQLIIEPIPSATCVRLNVMVFCLDLIENNDLGYRASSLILDKNDKPFKGANFKVELPKAGNFAIFIVAGISFFEGESMIRKSNSYACDFMQVMEIKNGLLITNELPKNEKPNIVLTDDGLDWEFLG